MLGHIQGRVASVAPDSSNPARFFASPRKTLLPFDIISMVASEIEQLAETIKECIAIRGIYLLMDERLDLICGPETLENIDSPQVTQKMAEFAARYGWSITRYQGGFVFCTDSAIRQCAQARSQRASRQDGREDYAGLTPNPHRFECMPVKRQARNHSD